MPVAVYLARDSHVYTVGGTSGLFTKIWSDPDAVAAAMPTQTKAGSWRQDGPTVILIAADGVTVSARGVIHGDTMDMSVISGEPVPDEAGTLQFTRLTKR